MLSIMKEYFGSTICFDDILLVPQNSNISSRHEVDLSMSIGDIELSLPVIAAPMDTVCDVEMCIAMAKSGGMGILHRYMSEDDQINKVKTLKEHSYGFGVAISSQKGFMNHAERLVNNGVQVLLIDTANGHGNYAINAVRTLRSAFGNDIHIMAGNVATIEGFRDIADAGANSVRVGIGGGSACTTRIVSGHGVPTLASIIDIAEWKDENSISCSIIADGGIRYSGDVAKAIAGGASTVMMGSLLAGTDEAPGEMIILEGRKFKSYRGMGSLEAMEDGSKDRYFQDAEDDIKKLVPEGIVGRVPFKGSVTEILYQMVGGLKAGMGYCGAASIEAMQQAKFVKITSAGVKESHPHDVSISKEAPNYSAK